MISASVLVVFPSPVILQRHQLIDVNLPAIDEAFLRRTESIGFRWMRRRIGKSTFRCDRHLLIPLDRLEWEWLIVYTAKRQVRNGLQNRAARQEHRSELKSE